MLGYTKTKYGGPEVLKLEEIPKPTPKPDEILVKIKANSANPADWHIMRGSPFVARFAFGLFKPKNKQIGADFAGVVEQVGSEVLDYTIGEKVFGEAMDGAFAEYMAVSPEVCARIPEGLDFKTMASMPIAGLTALQALVTHGNLIEGESVLINGSSGGVGHFAVQIAKAYGATVTGVCSNKNVDFVKSIGADKVIAYDEVEIHKHNEKYDLVLDTHGNLNFSDYKRMGKRGVSTGFTSMGHMMSVILKSSLSKFNWKQFTASADVGDLSTLAELVKEGKIKPHIEKTFSQTEIPVAIGYIEQMRTRGKVAIVWE